MKQTRYFEDFVIGEGRTTWGRTITETDVVVHAGHTGDFFPHHMDAEFMAHHPFGQRIAHGTLVLSIGVGLTASVVNPAAFSYGYDKLRFVKPVFIGDTICTRLTVAKKTLDAKRAGYGRVAELTEVLNQRQEIVLVCEHIYLVQCRPEPTNQQPPGVTV